eukprot:Nk52_evm1s2372 gene=Nk52_evmTU1s2372
MDIERETVDVVRESVVWDVNNRSRPRQYSSEELEFGDEMEDDPGASEVGGAPVHVPFEVQYDGLRDEFLETIARGLFAEDDINGDHIEREDVFIEGHFRDQHLYNDVGGLTNSQCVHSIFSSDTRKKVEQCKSLVADFYENRDP